MKANAASDAAQVADEDVEARAGSPRVGAEPRAAERVEPVGVEVREGHGVLPVPRVRRSS